MGTTVNVRPHQGNVVSKLVSIFPPRAETQTDSATLCKVSITPLGMLLHMLNESTLEKVQAEDLARVLSS